MLVLKFAAAGMGQSQRVKERIYAPVESIIIPQCNA
jgi:hypothetical protein